MCGIAGIAGISDEVLVRRMCQMMTHRGPDDEGVYVADGISLGARRLSIIDVAGGHQPISNEDGTMWVALNGEIYNFQNLRADLESHGHRFVSGTDTEVIVHAYEEYGQACVEKLRGMFAFALWDANQRRLWLVRDRLGVKPLYYTQVNGKLLFASEIKALLVDPDVKREVDHEALDAYLTFQYVPGPRTLFRNIWKLQPGHMLTYHRGYLRIQKYWDIALDADGGHAMSEARASEELMAQLEEAVRLRLISDVPLGALLSGGVDSGTVVGLMSRALEQPVQTFTVGFDRGGRAYDETPTAQRIARRFGADYHELIVRPSAVELLPKLMWHMDEPIADQAALPTYTICQFARQHVTVVLTGEGGDELLAGYPRYWYSQLADRYHHLPASLAQRLIPGGIARLPDLLPYPMRKVALSHPDVLERNVRWVSNFYPDQRQALYAPEFRQQLNGHNPHEIPRQYFDAARKQADPLTALLYTDVKVWLVDNLLMKVDKMSMANSLEAREPLLDHKLVEFVMRLPAALKVRKGVGKYILKQAVGTLLPDEVTRAPKHPFAVPAGEWFKHDVQALVQEILLSPTAQSRGYFNHGYIRQLIQRHQAGQTNASQKLWNLICFELWHELFIDPPSIAPEFASSRVSEFAGLTRQPVNPPTREPKLTGGTS